MNPVRDQNIQKLSDIASRYGLIIGLFLLTGVGLVCAFIADSPRPQEIEQNPAPKARPIFTKIEPIGIQAKSAYVIDGKTGAVIFSKNEEEQLPLASVTKLMTALVASESIPPHSSIVITKKALDTRGESGLTEGEVWNMETLSQFMLLASSNDAATALSLAAQERMLKASAQDGILSDEKVFVEKMNERAQALGLAHTHFTNPTGLDELDGSMGNVSSAEDVANLLRYLVSEHSGIMEITRYPVHSFSNSHETITATNTNEIVTDIPGFIAGKTGSTPSAGGNLVIAYDPAFNEPIVIAVLGSTDEGRFEDVKKIVEEIEKARSNSYDN